MVGAHLSTYTVWVPFTARSQYWKGLLSPGPATGSLYASNAQPANSTASGKLNASSSAAWSAFSRSSFPRLRLRWGWAPSFPPLLSRGPGLGRAQSARPQGCVPRTGLPVRTKVKPPVDASSRPALGLADRGEALPDRNCPQLECTVTEGHRQQPRGQGRAPQAPGARESYRAVCRPQAVRRRRVEA